MEVAAVVVIVGCAAFLLGRSMKSNFTDREGGCACGGKCRCSVFSENEPVNGESKQP
jgi:hypothetical protein